jgi:sugar phosphate isomerase/epimerase
MALGPDDLLLCAGTLARASFAERVEAAVAGGFRGLSLFGADYRRARAAGLSDADMRNMLSDAGLEIGELDPLMTWLPGATPGRGDFEATEDEFYAIAQALGARSINAVVFAPEVIDESVVVDSFAALCDRAAENDLLVHLEFMPWTQVPNAVQAWDLVGRADRPNGGIMFDSWHHFRSGLSNEELRAKVPAERILAVQLNDAPTEAEEDVIAETLNRRRLPGDGDIDLPAILRGLREDGAPAPLGVEVFCEDLFDLAPNEVARRCGDATRKTIAKSR